MLVYMEWAGFCHKFRKMVKKRSYASKTLSKTQQKYCTTIRELLASVVLIKHFHHYLWGRKFILRTDHESLKWLVNFREPEGMLARWLSVLSSYDLKHIIRVRYTPMLMVYPGSHQESVREVTVRTVHCQVITVFVS